MAHVRMTIPVNLILLVHVTAVARATLLTDVTHLVERLHHVHVMILVLVML